ncbi:unnamed protein product [Callosobruchus maculatus]|uniref:Uncharacterized protein n=1 Tax=Callosobruchus maculatus TaxID=64391 RepID=A0A653BKS8_CALMS|nr:unnamed protein product [Callosobruchus maculatus]
MLPDKCRHCSFISALSTFVNLAANRCYKIRMFFHYVIIQSYFTFKCLITVDTSTKNAITSYFGMIRN